MSSGRPASSVCCPAVPLIVRGAWLAALIGPPPVLELPGALSCEGLALSFSGLRALAALGLLAGIAFSGRISARPRRALCAVGMVSTAAYCALTVAALLKYLAFGASEAIVLGWFANCLVLFGSFACGAAWQRDLGKAETGAASFSRGLAARSLAFALLCLRSASLESWWEMSPIGRLPAFRIRLRPALMRRAAGTCSPTASPASRGLAPTCFEAACLTLGPLTPLAALHGVLRACLPPGSTSGAKAPRALRAWLLA